MSNKSCDLSFRSMVHNVSPQKCISTIFHSLKTISSTHVSMNVVRNQTSTPRFLITPTPFFTFRSPIVVNSGIVLMTFIPCLFTLQKSGSSQRHVVTVHGSQWPVITVGSSPWPLTTVDGSPMLLITVDGPRWPEITMHGSQWPDMTVHSSRLLVVSSVTEQKHY